MEHLDALRQSHTVLASVLEPMSDTDLEAPAYPTEWTIADVASHLGSGAVIMGRNVDNTLAGQATPDDFNQSVWDEWNAKTPRAKADDALAADQALLDRLGSLTEADTAGAEFRLGPMRLDFATLVSLRLNEHALHTWDIAVAVDPSAAVIGSSTALVIDNLAMLARFTAKPTGDNQRRWAIATTDPARTFVVAQSDGSVDFTASAAPAAADGDPADLMLPAEAFVRLVYGRLDAGHTPPVDGDPAVLDDLRTMFPGF